MNKDKVLYFKVKIIASKIYMKVKNKIYYQIINIKLAIAELYKA